MRHTNIPAGATPIAVIGRNEIVGRYCTPFGSPYGFGEGLGWYLHPDDTDEWDAIRLKRDNRDCVERY